MKKKDKNTMIGIAFLMLVLGILIGSVLCCLGFIKSDEDGCSLWCPMSEETPEETTTDDTPVQENIIYSCSGIEKPTSQADCDTGTCEDGECVYYMDIAGIGHCECAEGQAL